MKPIKIQPTLKFLLLILIIVFTLSSCQKDLQRIIAVKTKEAQVQNNNVIAKGEVTDLGENGIKDYGFVYGGSENPTTDNYKKSKGTKFSVGDFTDTIKNLNFGNYYIRAFVFDGSDTKYGENKTFSIIPMVATLTTASVSNITLNSATSGGNVTSDGGSTVLARGVCWSTSSNPVATGSHTTDGTGLGTFTSNITGLTASTTYFVRAYATNSIGTAYGNEVSFTAGQSITTPIIATTAASAITQTTATSGGNVTSDGGATVTARGVCWSTSSNPVATGSHTTDGTGTGSFISSITGLSANTLYYVRAYATNSTGTSYGSQISFTTTANIVAPTVTTTATSAIAQTTATSGGNVTSDGGATVTARGVCWSTNSNPVATGSHTTDGTGTGSFTSSLTGLIANTTYYVRAYAANSAGTAYGSQITFITTQNIVIPTVTTTVASNITQNTATSGGNVTSDGGGIVTAHGVCWSISQNPIVTGSHTTDGTGTGSFTSNLTSLSYSTTYYIRAYATNSAGTAYGSQVNFTTIAAITSIGATFAGGLVFYIDNTGQHGLVVAPSAQPSAQWGCDGTAINGADGSAVGTGLQNTIDIVNGCSTTGIAAQICSDLVLNGYSDWFLPSVDEFNLIYQNIYLNGLGGISVDTDWWTSTETNSTGNSNNYATKFRIGYGYGQVNFDSKYYVRQVRAVRAF